MKLYMAICSLIAFLVVIFVMIAPRLISADDDIAVTCGYFLMTASLPIIYWFIKKIVHEASPIINHLKELKK